MNISKERCGADHRALYRLQLLAVTVSVLFFASLVLAGCGRNESASDTPVSGAAESATPDGAEQVGGTVPPAPEVQATAALTSAEMQIPVVTLEPTPDLGLLSTPTSTGVETITGTGEITATPLVVDEGIGCQIDSDLDLAGYDGVEEMMGCPLEAATFDPVGLNEFGEGPDYDRFMLWFGWEGQIYVLLPDGAWRAYEDTWVEGRDPTFSCNPSGGEPASPPLPRRGFGKLWCQEAGLQETLGAVEREERLCQHTVVQRFEQGRVVACFEDATVRYFRIMNDDNVWHLDMQR